MNQLNPEQTLALNVIMAFVKGTPNRAYRAKKWETKILDLCLKALGADQLYESKKCSCGGVFARFGEKALCLSCGKEHTDFRSIRCRCKECGKPVMVYVWSAEEEKKELASDYHYCNGWCCKR